MGYKVTTPVWELSRAKGGDLLVLLAIAESADNTTGDAYPSVVNLAEMSRLSERSVQYSIRNLEEMGELVVVVRKGHRTNKYHVALFERFWGAKIAPQKPTGEVQRLHLSEPEERCKDCTPEAPPRGAKIAPERCNLRHPEVQSATSTYKVLIPVLSLQSLSHGEREETLKELKRLCPSVLSLPEQIPIERAYLFVHKIKTGEIRKEQIFSPVAYLMKMADEDITPILERDRARKKARASP